MSTRILVPLAPGFEEIEAVTIVDVLRRADFVVTLAGTEPGILAGSRGVRIEPDALLDELVLDGYDAIVLPGGMAGALALAEHAGLLEALRRQRERGACVAAICAAPMVLARAGIESDLELTSHASVRDRLGSATVRSDARVLRDRHVFTSQGPGTALEFALALVEELAGPDQAAELAEAMVVAERAETVIV